MVIHQLEVVLKGTRWRAEALIAGPPTLSISHDQIPWVGAKPIILDVIKADQDNVTDNDRYIMDRELWLNICRALGACVVVALPAYGNADRTLWYRSCLSW